MGKKKKDTIELRFYEVPHNESVLALLGDKWIRCYGHDDTNLHFHNLMEIGCCRDGTGRLVLNERECLYQPAMISVIPQNYPHITISEDTKEPSFWEYLFFDPVFFLKELYAGDELRQREILGIINREAWFLHEEESGNLVGLVTMVMEEMRSRKKHYQESVHSLMLALVIELIRMNETTGIYDTDMYKKTGITQIGNALDYIREKYAGHIKVEDLANACGMSETHFRRVFESYMNMSPMDYVNLTRIQASCERLKKTTDSMDEVAEKVGFATTSTFNRNFKKFLNTSPYQWKIKQENYESKLPGYHITALKGW